MERIKFFVNKAPKGFDAYAEGNNWIVATFGDNASQLKRNIVEAYNEHATANGISKIEENQVALVFNNVQTFFALFEGEVTAAGISKRSGIQQALLSDYVRGKRRPSPKQVEKVFSGIRDLAAELSNIELVV